MDLLQVTTLPSHATDITGVRSGRLVAVECAGKNKHNVLMWRCVCDCGGESIRTSTAMRRGEAISCGCVRREKTSAHLKGKAKYEGCGMPEYQCWHSMIRRCTWTGDKDYYRYGAVGITVCTQWLTSCAQMVADIGPRPTPQHTLDRYPNKSGNYEPGNVRWALPVEQSRNTKTNRLLTFNGITRCATEWADEVGITRDCMFARLRDGWPVDRILTTPMKPDRRRKAPA